MDALVGCAAVFCLVSLGLFLLVVTYDLHKWGGYRLALRKRDTENCTEALKVRREELEFAKRVRDEDRRREEWTYPDTDDDD